MEAINAQGILEHVDVLNRFMSNFLDSTRILKCVSDRKERRTQKPLVKSSTNAKEGLQNLDNSTPEIRLTASAWVARAKSETGLTTCCDWFF